MRESQNLKAAVHQQLTSLWKMILKN
jgi:hypothetical protein